MFYDIDLFENKRKRNKKRGTIELAPSRRTLLNICGGFYTLYRRYIKAACIRWLARQSLWHEQHGIHNWAGPIKPAILWQDSQARSQWHIPLPETAIWPPFPVLYSFPRAKGRARAWQGNTERACRKWYRQRDFVLHEHATFKETVSSCFSLLSLVYRLGEMLSLLA